MAAAWPTTKPVYPLEESVYKPALRTEFEAGYVQSRARCTRARRRFTLHWPAMAEAEYGALEEHFIANQGASFSWTHPVSSTSYTVRYAEDVIAGKPVLPGNRDVVVRLEEV